MSECLLVHVSPKYLKEALHVAALRFDERPILVFWESTRACLLACQHCRAEAMAAPMPGELSTEQGMAFIDSLVTFGRPYPVLIFTGGDVMMRPDVFTLAKYAKSLQIPIGMAPSVTPRLTDAARNNMKEVGVKTVSISLDGAKAGTHDGIRGIPGHFEQTVQAMRDLVADGFEVQVNTVVMQENVDQLPALVELLKSVGVRIWEVFFLIQVGRGRGAHSVTELPPQACEDVCQFLFDASTYDLTVRTVEAPFFRRVVAARKGQLAECAGASNGERLMAPPVASFVKPAQTRPLYELLSSELRHRLGPATSASRAQTSGTRDGKGIVFVAYDGTVYPAGFLPVRLGSILEQPLADIYRNNPLLRDIRAARFSGRCGTCEFQDLCGGSRSRAFARTGDPLAEDPSCPYSA